MKKCYRSMLLALALIAVGQAFGQQRYIDQIFTDVTKSTTLYGSNFTVLYLAPPPNGLGHTVRQPLAADVYTPVGDTKTDRPVVVYWHTGNFLPHPQNGGTGGKRDDLTAVEICTRFAKMGYVAISADYRLGWNPVAMDSALGLTTRIFTLINAAYRGVQDCNTMSRFLKHTVADLGNPLGIDPNKICMFGQGTGGYITLNTAVLDTVTETYLPKFFLPPALGGLPMVLEPISNNVQCTNPPTFVPNPYLPGFPPGDTLSVPNWTGFSSKFTMAVNLGGAMGDLSWIANGKGTSNVPPTISFHCPSDPFAPYDCGVLTVPVVNLPVVEVCGGHKVQQAFDAAGINNIWKNVPELEAIGLSKKDNSEGLTTLYNIIPQVQKGKVTTSPYDIWAWNNTNIAAAGLNDSIAARLYIDTVMAYCAPRMCIGLGLGCNLAVLNTTQLDEAALGLTVSPNPATEDVTFETAEKAMESIYVYDLSGRLVKAHVNIDSNKFTMPRAALGSGLYFAELRFAEGVVTKKIVFN